MEPEHFRLSALDELIFQHQEIYANADSVASRIKRHLMCGEMEEVDDLLSSMPGILQDSHMQFRLGCQKLIEMLRDPTKHDSALNYLQTELTPMAMHAYPEAYDELKNHLLAFMYAEDKLNSPIGHLWDPQTRNKLAGQCSRFIRQTRGETDSKLVCLLKFLALSTQSLVAAQPSEIEDSLSLKLENLLLSADLLCLLTSDKRESVPIAPSAEAKWSSEHMDAVETEGHIQMMMLKSMFNLSREETKRSVKQSNCDPEETLRNELTALPHSQPIIDEMVREYMEFRNLRNISRSKGADAKCHVGQGLGLITQGAAEKSASSAHPRDSSCSPPKKVSRCEIQDRGDSAEYNRGRISEGAEKAHVDSKCPSKDVETVQQAAKFVRAGAIEEAMDLVNRLDPRVLKERVELHFHLQSAHYSQLLSRDEVDEALRVLQQVITPLVQECKIESITLEWNDLPMLLLSSEKSRCPDLDLLADVMESLLYEHLDIKPSRLVYLLQHLIAAHKRYLESQMCPDYFGKTLGLEALQSVGLCHDQSHIVDSATADSSKAAKPNSAADEEMLKPLLDRGNIERQISNAMDITNLPRAVVIPLLQQSGGDVNRMLEIMFNESPDLGE